ncbi:MAG: hypothetical protein A2057_08040 [Ignavibacteria bacterium GWA2_35_9]|nr:MAG: hypothetical protein A2057_08040 [Ignavibacteria bacterium GWA2_35_9]
MYKLQVKRKMKIKLFVLLFLMTGLSFPWGDKGHKLIANKAVELLKEKIKNIEQYQDYITEHSVDPDTRKDQDKTEGPKHYIDIDFYKEFLEGRMIQDKDQLISLYSDSVVTKMGLLPWATLETLKNLTKAFKEKNRDKVLIYTSDMAHYVGDAHQPMHTILNYDGQFTNQKGVHARYEIYMVNKYIDELSDGIKGLEVAYVKEPLDYIFNHISDSNSLSEVLFAADKFAASKAGSMESDEYLRLLWFKTKYITGIQFEEAYNSLASLIYTAWVDAGEPSFSEIN